MQRSKRRRTPVKSLLLQEFRRIASACVLGQDSAGIRGPCTLKPAGTRQRPARGRRENSVSERPSAPDETKDAEPRDIALGAEKIGLLPLHAPVLSLLIVLLL